MEGLVAAVTYIETHPGVAALLEVVTIGCIIYLHRAGKRGRAKLHERIDELDNKFTEHDKVDEYRYGRIEGTLGRIETSMTGQETP